MLPSSLPPTQPPIPPGALALSGVPGSAPRPRRGAVFLAGLVACVAMPALAGCGEGISIRGPGVRDGDDAAGRAIAVSLDGLNEAILRRTLTREQVPTLHDLLENGACADHAVPAFPSLTAPSHAVLWTGAYGDVTGATANSQHRLPRDRHTVLQLTSGFLHDVLGAEPLWVTAGRAGVSFAGHHVTQGPGIPGYPPVEGERTPWQETRRAEARDAMARPGVDVLRGYQWMLEPHRVLSAAEVEWVEAGPWGALEGAPGDEGQAPGTTPVEPRAFRWETGAGVFHGVLHGVERYDRVTLSASPQASRRITAHLHPPEEEGLEGREGGEARELARFFSPALERTVLAGELEPGEPREGRVYLRARLFHVAEDGSDFLLYLPALQPVAGNTPELMEAYDGAVEGWIGNSAMSLYLEGAFGPTLAQGGDGTAEARYLESAELLLRQFMRGSEWMWRERTPRLMVDYFPLSDTVDHQLLGFLSEEWPGYDGELARTVASFRARAWALVDRRLAHLLELAREADAALFVTGDHGMRPSWNLFLPNVALQEAGLLALAADGSVDLSRTRAVSPNGYWISVNRMAWQGGVVPPEEEAEVVAAARRALESVVDGAGNQVVTRTFIPEEHPEMGIGGAAGGDLYWGTAPGYRSVGSLTGEGAAIPGRLTAGHGFPPDEPDMYTVFCGTGPGMGSGVRIGPVRTTVVAPTLAEYTGMPAPADAVGVSVLAEMRGEAP
jgi:predicted AlkP superfamily phosphohydrolase/phosphomutase